MTRRLIDAELAKFRRQERDARIVELREQGMTLSAIGREVGLTEQGVHHAYRRITGHPGYWWRGKPAPDYVVYWYYDTDGRLLYIGYTEDFGQREKQHSRDDRWYPEIVDTHKDRYESKAEAMAAEARAIQAERPKYNKYHNQGIDLEEAALLWVQLNGPARKVCTPPQGMHLP